MLRFLCRLVFFLGLILGVKALAWWVSEPHWRQNVSSMGYKSNQFDRLQTACNAVFIGSSRTGMSIIPSRFDSLTNSGLRSFNYGVASFFAPHTFQLAESLLRQPDRSLRYVFVELSLPCPILIEEPFLFNPLAEMGYRARLWRLYKDLTSGPSLDTWINEYTLALLSPKSCLRYSPSGLRSLLGKPARVNRPANPTTIPYDFVSSPDGYLRDSRLNAAIWQADTALLPDIHRLARQAFSLQTTDACNAAYWADINILLQLAKTQHIELMFYLPNRLLPAEARLLPPIFNRLPVVNRLAISPDDRFDALFSRTSSFNKGHLNHQGAQQYTTLLAEAFSRVNQRVVVAQTSFRPRY